jgi:hypothetical protein
MDDRFPGRPEPSEYAAEAGGYVALVPEVDILGLLEAQAGEVRTLLGGITEDVAEMRHRPYTWSIKEVVGHLTDCERIFGVRALRFVRADPTPLPGFEENAYARAAGFDATPLADLLAEWATVRQSHLFLFRRLDGAAWRRQGIANDHEVSVRALAYIIAGHTRHHLKILQGRLAGL